MLFSDFMYVYIYIYIISTLKSICLTILTHVSTESFSNGQGSLTEILTLGSLWVGPGPIYGQTALTLQQNQP